MICQEADKWHVVIHRGQDIYQWGPYPTALEAQAVENRLVKQFAKEDAEDQRAGRGPRRERVPPGWRQGSLL